MSISSQKSLVKQVLTYIWDMPCCATYDIALDKYALDEKKDAVRAYLKMGDSITDLHWHLIALNDKVYIVNKDTRVNTRIASRNPNTGDVTYIDGLQDMIESLVINSAFTVNAVVTDIVSNVYFNSDNMSNDYYNIYPSISDYFTDLFVSINGQSPIDLNDAQSTAEMNTSIGSIQRITVDILGKSLDDVINTQGASASVHSEHVPLFRFTVSKDILSFSRYTRNQNRGYTFQRDVDDKNVATETKLPDKALTSNKVYRVKIPMLINQSSDKVNLLNEWIKKCVDDFIISDNVSSLNGLGQGAKVILARQSTLETVINSTILEKNGLTSAHRYAIDNFPNWYTPGKSGNVDSNVQVSITDSEYALVGITYSVSGVGLMITIHINPDQKLLVNNKDLNDPRNIFVINRAQRALITYNTGSGMSEPVIVTHDVAFAIAWQLIVIGLGLQDIYNVANMTTEKSRGSTATVLDKYGATVQYNIKLSSDANKMPKVRALATIYSRTNKSELENSKVSDVNRMNISLTADLSTKSLVCETELAGEYQYVDDNGQAQTTHTSMTRKFEYNTAKTENRTNGRRSNMYNEAVGDLHEESAAKRNKRTIPAPKTLGAIMHRHIETYINKNETKTERELNMGDANVKTRINSALRFQPKSPIGTALIQVRDAFIRTFEPLAGTVSNPGLLSSGQISAEDYNMVSQFIQVNGSKTPMPVMGEFRVDHGYSGDFVACPTSSGRVAVYCTFPGDAYREVGQLVGQKGKQELSDDFIIWYLDTCFDVNHFATQLVRAIEDEDWEVIANIPERLKNLFDVNDASATMDYRSNESDTSDSIPKYLKNMFDVNDASTAKDTEREHMTNIANDVYVDDARNERARKQLFANSIAKNL